MYQEILEKLGLTVNESKVYEALLNTGISTANDIALEARIQRRNVYDTVKQLKEKGLASEIVDKGIRKFKAIHPQQLRNKISEQESLLEQVLPEMTAKFEAIDPIEQTLVFKGIDAVKNFYWDIVKSGDDLWVLGGRGNWLDARWKFFLPKFDRERLAKGIRFRHLFYHELKDKKHPKHRITKILKDNEYRFLPKDFSSTCSIEISGNRVASMYWEDEPLLVVIISKPIAQGYKKYFEFMWQHCEKGNT